MISALFLAFSCTSSDLWNSYQNMIRLFETARTRMRTFLAHPCWIARAFSTLPETMAAFAYQYGMANTAVLRPEVLFSGALSNVSNKLQNGIMTISSPKAKMRRIRLCHADRQVHVLTVATGCILARSCSHIQRGILHPETTYQIILFACSFG